MNQDKDLPPSQPSESANKNVNKNKDLRRKSVPKTTGETTQPSTSSGTLVSATSADVVSKRLETLSISSGASAEPNSVPKKSPKRKITSTSGNKPVVVNVDSDNENRANNKQKRPNKGQEAQKQPSTLNVGGAIGGAPVKSKVGGQSTASNLTEGAASSASSPQSVSGKTGKKKGNNNQNAGRKPEQTINVDQANDVTEAFNKEDAEDAEEANKPKHAAKASAEAAFAELEKYTGIRLDQTDQSSLCLRPRFASGIGGVSTNVRTNFFRLKIAGNSVHQYNIIFLKSDESSAIKKEVEIGRKFKRLTKILSQRLLARFVQTTGSDLFNGLSYAYDNDRILITSKPLPGISPTDGKIFQFQISEIENEAPRIQTIHIRIKPTVELPLVFEKNVDNNRNIVHNRAVLQVLDIIAKASAFQSDIIYGSKIFLPAEKRIRTVMEVRGYPTPYELAFGYHQSTQLCQGGAMQIIDRATAVLYKGGPLIETIEKLLSTKIDRNTKFGPREHEALKELTYLRFETSYRGFPSRHTIRSFSRKPCKETYFNGQDGRQKSVADYFRDHHELNLNYPGLPCVEYIQGKFIPIELCTLLPDQRNQRKLREELIRIVSQHTTSQRPHDRSIGTIEVARNISDELGKNQFKIQLVPSQVEVKSRILASPTLIYGNKPAYAPQDPGNWDMKDKKFLTPKTLTRWACYALQSRKIDAPVAKRFVETLQHNGNALGMRIEFPCLPFNTLGPDQLEKALKGCAKERLQLIVIMMPENTDLYALVKSLGDQKLGIPTQVVLDKHYDSRNQRQKLFDTAYQCNLLLKINMKIGGTNLRLNDNCIRASILSKKTMVVGIDVNHPSPGEQSPSIAAVVGSIDEDFSQYRTEIRVNSSRDEIVAVDQMMVPILKAFKAKRGDFPDNIIVYRDGVSEGQFAAVMGSEILPLHKKLETLPNPPTLTYIIVQKRHNARFFPTDKTKATRNGNILPGSVIDTDVCHYKWFDFYLCSQNSFLGTARPGKYTVLWHSSPANANELQTATYYLCYLFARATKSIADPAPARYAHHAAARGKVHLKEILRNRQRPNDRDINIELNNVINVTDNLKQILYFI